MAAIRPDETANGGGIAVNIRPVLFSSSSFFSSRLKSQQQLLAEHIDSERDENPEKSNTVGGNSWRHFDSTMPSILQEIFSIFLFFFFCLLLLYLFVVVCWICLAVGTHHLSSSGGCLNAPKKSMRDVMLIGSRKQCFLNTATTIDKMNNCNSVALLIYSTRIV